MKYLVSILIGCALVLGIYYAREDPKITALFEDQAEPKENPLDFLENVPEPQLLPPEPETPPARRRDEEGARTSADVPPQTEPSSSAAAANQVPNNEVARVLVQILRARGLSDGISLSVTDEAIAVYGEVPSRAVLRQIVEILEKGREARSIDTKAVEIKE